MVVGGQVLTHWLPDSEGSLSFPLPRSRAGHIKADAPSLPLLEARIHIFFLGKTRGSEWVKTLSPNS